MIKTEIKRKDLIDKELLKMFKVDDVFSKDMILQRDVKNNISGNADSGSEVAVRLAKGSKVLFEGSARADDGSRWKVTLPAVEGSCEPYELTVSCGNDKTVIDGVLFGDVYHITGQSNMELPMSRTFSPFMPFKKPDCAFVREYRVPIVNCFDPDVEDKVFVGGSWVRSDAPEAMSMSAAGYFFAKELFESYGIPIGLVNTSAGGAPIEGRLPYSFLKEYGDYDEFLAKVTVPNYIENTVKEDMERDSAYFTMLHENDKIGDSILKGSYPDGEEISLPWDINDFAGRVWFWTEVNVPKDFPLDGAMLILGTLTDSDSAYVNGEKVGETGYMYPPRYYRITEGILKHGINRIAVKLDIFGGYGGFTEGKRWCLKSGDSIIDLTSGWKFAKAVTADKKQPGVFFQGLPLAVYGKTTAPAYNLNFKGMLIYQAESNGGNAEKYADLFTKWVRYYRKRCGYDIPVIATQLPEFGIFDDGSWAELRRQQLKCCDIPNTSMAVTIGTGEYNDLHPINKWDVGKRLAICAKALIYENGDAYPIHCVSHEIKDGKLILNFSHPVKLVFDEADSYFEAVNGDKKEKLQAEQYSNSIALDLGSTEPQAIRYAWRTSPSKPQLFDKDGLPVSPFEYKLR